MDYEKKYKEALERAKALASKCLTNRDKVTMIYRLKDIENLFPELKESEDEKMRKAIHIYLDWLDSKKEYAPKGEYSIRNMIAWLEKQGDYNRLIEEIKKRKILLSIEKEKATSANDRLSLGGRIAMLEELLTFIKEKQDEQKYTNFYCQENCKGFQETGRCFADGECKAKRDAEQNPAWSEKDEKAIGIIEIALKHPYDMEGKWDRKFAEDWLKSLKDKIHWKPTKSQLEFLLNMS